MALKRRIACHLKLLCASDLNLPKCTCKTMSELSLPTGQVGLGVGLWPSNQETKGLNPKGTRLYFVILLKNVEKIFDWH